MGFTPREPWLGATVDAKGIVLVGDSLMDDKLVDQDNVPIPGKRGPGGGNAERALAEQSGRPVSNFAVGGSGVLPNKDSRVGAGRGQGDQSGWLSATRTIGNMVGPGNTVALGLGHNDPEVVAWPGKPRADGTVAESRNNETQAAEARKTFEQRFTALVDNLTSKDGPGGTRVPNGANVVVFGTLPYAKGVAGLPKGTLDEGMSEVQKIQQQVVDRARAAGKNVSFADTAALAGEAGIERGDAIHPSKQGASKLGGLWAKAIEGADATLEAAKTAKPATDVPAQSRPVRYDALARTSPAASLPTVAPATPATPQEAPAAVPRIDEKCTVKPPPRPKSLSPAR